MESLVTLNRLPADARIEFDGEGFGSSIWTMSYEDDVPGLFNEGLGGHFRQHAVLYRFKIGCERVQLFGKL